ARLGSDFARHSFPDCRGSQPEVGRRERMHELRQVRASVPDRSAGGEGLGRRRDGQEKRQYQLAGPPERSPGMKKVKVATVWLDGCSGCHMSLLDMDAAIISLAQKIELVYGPLVDAQEFPEDVDVTLVEGAVSSQDDLNKLKKIRQRTRLLISLGDCAVTGNVPAMRIPSPCKSCCIRFTSKACKQTK